MEVPATITGQKPKISVWLSNKYENQIKYFHCPVCGSKVFGYFSDVKIILGGEGAFEKAPITVQCQGASTVVKDGRKVTSRCKTIFYLA